jgi:hypothetical protein
MRLRHFSRLAVISLTTFVLCAGVQGYAGDTKITKNDVPAPVMKAFEQAYPKATVKGYGKEVENGTTYYELETVEGNTKRDLLYHADGKVAEIEESVTMKDLPDAVAKTYAKESSGATASKIEKVTKGTKVTYDFTMGKGKSELVIDPSGKVVQHSKAVKESNEKEGAGEENEKD